MEGTFTSLISDKLLKQKVELQGGVYEEAEPNEQVNLKDIQNFSRLYWYLAASCGISYACHYPFNSNLQELLQVRFKFTDETESSRIASIQYVISVILVPILGFNIDKFGRRCNYLFVNGSDFYNCGAHFFIFSPRYLVFFAELLR